VVPHRPRRRFASPIAALLAVLALLLPVALAGCAAAPSFDPAGSCLVDGNAVDGRAPGAYPDLEALVPTTYDGRAPDRLDSGRNCSDKNLGTLRARGVTEVRFAGGLWEVGQRSGVSLAVFEAAGLTPAILFEFYETGARTSSRTDATETSEVDISGVAGRRLDTLNAESYQTVITWGGQDGRVRVVLVGSDVRETQTRSAHEARVRAALAAFAKGR